MRRSENSLASRFAGGLLPGLGERDGRFAGLKPRRVHLPDGPRIFQSKTSRLYLRGVEGLEPQPVGGLEPEATLARGVRLLQGMSLPGCGRPTWWIGVGTALGFSRDGGFIAHDTDIDVRVALDFRRPRRALASAAAIVRGFRMEGFELVREMYWELRPMQTAFVDTRNNEIILDVYYFYSGIKAGHFVNYNWEGFREKPARFVDGIRACPWPGHPEISVNVPQPIEEYNAWRWGPDWRVPKRNSELTERDLKCIRPLPSE